MDSTDPVEELARRSAGLRVALVHDWLVAMRGGEKVFEHVCALFPQADVFTILCDRSRLSEPLRRRKIVESAAMASLPARLRRNFRALLPLMPTMVERFPTDGYDLVVATSHCVAKGVRPPSRGALLAYVFTPMRYVWDHFDDYLSGNLLRDAAMHAARGRLQRWDRATARRIDSIAVDSDHIGAKVRAFWGRKATTIRPPADVDFFTPAPLDSDGGYFLTVGALVPYKHIDRAVQAARTAGVRLVVVGDGPERGRLEQESGPTVDLRGWVSDSELRELYRGCRALVYPGIEDFGIAAVEAQACGRPVLALRGGGTLETIVEGATGEFFDDPEPESLASLLTNFDPSRYSSDACRAQALRFDPASFRRALAAWILAGGGARCW